MKVTRALPLLVLMASGSALATERYTEARISQIETSENSIILECIRGRHAGNYCALSD